MLGNILITTGQCPKLVTPDFCGPSDIWNMVGRLPGNVKTWWQHGRMKGRQHKQRDDHATPEALVKLETKTISSDLIEAKLPQIDLITVSGFHRHVVKAGLIPSRKSDFQRGEKQWDEF